MRAIFCYNWYKDKKFVSPPMDWARDRTITDLTIGEEYKVFVAASSKDRYVIVKGFMNDYPKHLFITLDEIRDIKLRELGIV